MCTDKSGRYDSLRSYRRREHISVRNLMAWSIWKCEIVSRSPVNTNYSYYASSDEEFEGLSGILDIFEVIGSIGDCGPDI